MKHELVLSQVTRDVTRRITRQAHRSGSELIDTPFDNQKRPGSGEISVKYIGILVLDHILAHALRVDTERSRDKCAIERA